MHRSETSEFRIEIRRQSDILTETNVLWYRLHAIRANVGAGNRTDKNHHKERICMKMVQQSRIFVFYILVIIDMCYFADQ
mmetsp:Transcript_6358/g.13954  ORF Transcript_6358/g.13954 Transcript_6358/m.13954 type:complete len:80 (-) Transcript_6358:135-374(-)